MVVARLWSLISMAPDMDVHIFFMGVGGRIPDPATPNQGENVRIIKTVR